MGLTIQKHVEAKTSDWSLVNSEKSDKGCESGCKHSKQQLNKAES